MERLRVHQARGGIFRVSIFSALYLFFYPALALGAAPDTSASVARYTVAAVVSVLLLGMALGLALKLVRGLGLIDEGHQYALRQRLRVLFGATLMLAAVSPYVALNFSMTVLIPFVATAGLIIMTWAWGATKVEVLELDVDREIR